MIDAIFPVPVTAPKSVWSTFDVLITATIFTFSLYVLQWVWSRRKLYYASLTTNGPFGFPIIGSGFYFMGSTEQTLKNIMMLNWSYTSPLSVWLGHKLFFSIRKPEEFDIILNSPKAYKKEGLYRFAKKIVGNGLFTADVETWKRHRKIIMPTFNQKILDQFVEVFAEQGEIYVKILKDKHLNKGPFDVFKTLSLATLDIICETAMGIKVNAQTKNHFFVEAANRVMNIVYTKMFNVLYHFDFIYNRTQLSVEEDEVINKIHEFTSEVVVRKREAYTKAQKERKENPECIMDEEEIVPKRKAFLDLLIELSEKGDKFTDKELTDEVNTMMIAGSDTTAGVNSYVFLMLGMHSEVQDKVYEEMFDIFGNSDRPVTVDDLPLMKYTERVIKETMRLFPVGPAIVRSVTEDLRINKNLVLPKGCSVVLAIICLHRDPEIYPDPLKFDPDRFAPEEVAKRHPYCFVPFSGGPRNCIGPKYAMMAMKAMISTIIRNYRITTPFKRVEDIRLKQDILMKPVDGFQISVHPRN